MGRGKSSADASSLTAGFTAAGIITRPVRSPQSGGVSNNSPGSVPGQRPSLVQLYRMGDADVIAFLERSLVNRGTGRLRDRWPDGPDGVNRGPTCWVHGSLKAEDLVAHHGVSEGGVIINHDATCVQLKHHSGNDFHNHEMVVFAQRYEAEWERGSCLVILTDGPHMKSTRFRVFQRHASGKWVSPGTVGRDSVRGTLAHLTVAF